MRGRSGRLLVAAALVAGLGTVVGCAGPEPVPEPTTPPAVTGHAADPPPAACEPGWGSTARSVAQPGAAPVVAVQTGGGACADRVEFDVAGPAVGYAVEYVDQVVQDGSGAPVAVPGGARLLVQLHHPAYDDAGRPTLAGRAGQPLPVLPGLRTLRSVVFAGSFEGDSTFGIGVRARLPFRVTVIDGDRPRSRIRLEVAHGW